MTIPAIIAIVLSVLVCVGLQVAEQRKTRRLLDRPCAGIHWHRRFPNVPHDDVRKFLHLFTDAFYFDAVHATKFGPDDQPQEIYHARYVPHLTIDDHL
jgi:hypothetical protein